PSGRSHWSRPIGSARWAGSSKRPLRRRTSRGPAALSAVCTDRRSPEPRSCRRRPSRGGRGPPLPRAPQLLSLLEDLAFGLDRRSDDQLRLLELADRARPDRAHAGSDRADQIERAVLGEGGAEEDL